MHKNPPSPTLPLPTPPKTLRQKASSGSEFMALAPGGRAGFVQPNFGPSERQRAGVTTATATTAGPGKAWTSIRQLKFTPTPGPEKEGADPMSAFP
jgi:hypothetical protein